MLRDVNKITAYLYHKLLQNLCWKDCDLYDNFKFLQLRYIYF